MSATQGVCEVNECGRRKYAKGVCSAHYKAAARAAMTPEQREAYLRGERDRNARRTSTGPRVRSESSREANNTNRREKRATTPKRNPNIGKNSVPHLEYVIADASPADKAAVRHHIRARYQGDDAVLLELMLGLTG